MTKNERQTAAQHPIWRPRPIDWKAIEGLIAERGEFRWHESAHGQLRSVNYTWVESRTFDTETSLECRGLAMDTATARIAARPLHKFFNWGERPASDATIDLRAPHYVMDKLDGSLMFPAEIETGQVLWCTRAGRTPIAGRLQAMLDPGVWARAARLVRAPDGTPWTPCFEHTSPENRIVLRYARPALTLLAIRERESGRYLTTPEVRAAAARAGLARDAGDPLQVGVRPQHEAVTWSDAAASVREIEARRDQEGVVLVLEDGHRVKVKTREYADLHELRSHLDSERRLLRCVLEERVDTLEQLLGDIAGPEIRAYRDDVTRRIDALARETWREVAALCAAHAERGAFARAWSGRSDGVHRGIGFQARTLWERGTDAGEAVHAIRGRIVASALRKCGSARKVDTEVRTLIGHRRWESPVAQMETG